MTGSDSNLNSKSTPPGLTPYDTVVLPDGTQPVPLGSGTITALLGKGGMSNVYEVWNQQLEVTRAVKLLHPNCSEESKQRFQTEMKITAKLHHPNIIEIHGVGQWNDIPYIEMEKINGINLSTLIETRGAMPVEVCTAVGIMICRALHYAHNQEYMIYGTQYHGIIHRDLKPSNIMVCNDGVVKLMDFGIARPTDGAILGTMQYLAPEQLQGEDADVRSDVYSLGCTLYEILTGVQAFEERNVSKLMMKKVCNEYRPLDGFKKKVPLRLRWLVHKSMALSRDKRIANTSVLLAELEKIHAALTSDSPNTVMRQFINEVATEKIQITARRRIAMLPVITALAVIAAVAISPYLYQRLKPLSKPAPVVQAPAVTVPIKPDSTAKAATPAAPAAAAAKPNAAPRSPTASSKREPPNVRSLAQLLNSRYGEADALAAMASELSRGDFRAVGEIYQLLPPGQADQPQAVASQLRALMGLRDRRGIQQLIGRHSLNDAIYFLAQAQVAYADGRTTEANQLLEKCLQVPCQYMASDVLRIEVLYLQALCVSAAFERGPGESTYKEALDAWWELRNELRSKPNHPYETEARTQIQRIGEKFRHSKE
jgi:serine/threonine protein kinase